MEKLKVSKVLYIAPEMKSTEFCAEFGYAISVATEGTKITMKGENL